MTRLQFSLKDCTAWRKAGPAVCHCKLDAVPPATYTWPLEAAAAITACSPLPVTNSYLQQQHYESIDQYTYASCLFSTTRMLASHPLRGNSAGIIAANNKLLPLTAEI